MNRSFAAIAGLAAVALSVAACSSDDKGGTSSYCNLVASYKLDSDKVSDLLNADNPDTAAVKDTFERMKPKISQLLADAPSNIKTDLQLATEAQLSAIDMFEQYSYDLATITTSPEYTDLQSKYDTPEQTAAIDRLDAWAKDTCGIDMGSNGESSADTSPSIDTTASGGDGTAPVETMTVDETVTGDASAPGAGTELCAINDELNNDPSPLDEETPDPAAVQEYFTTYVPKQMARLTAAAPDELKDEIATLVAGIETFSAVLESHGWDADTAYNDPKMIELLGEDTPFTLAGAALDSYCGTNL